MANQFGRRSAIFFMDFLFIVGYALVRYKIEPWDSV